MSHGIRNAAIVGGGTMGVGIAASFCAGGWPTHIVEPDASRREALRRSFDACLRQLDCEQAALLSVHPDLADIDWQQIDLVVECVPESLDLKHQVFREMEAASRPDTLLTSNSSSFPISAIAEGLPGQGRMAGLHFFMPAHLIPLVEVVSGTGTQPETAKRLCSAMTAIGKRPAHVKKDIAGFLANRIQHALMREALSLAEQGIATPEDIDTAVQFGFGMRYLGAGPFLQKDIAGLDVHSAAARTIYPTLCNDTRPSTILTDPAERGDLGMKTGRGFFDWTEEDSAERKARYESALIAALKVLNT